MSVWQRHRVLSTHVRRIRNSCQGRIHLWGRYSQGLMQKFLHQALGMGYRKPKGGEKLISVYQPGENRGKLGPVADAVGANVLLLVPFTSPAATAQEKASCA